MFNKIKIKFIFLQLVFLNSVLFSSNKIFEEEKINNKMQNSFYSIPSSEKSYNKDLKKNPLFKFKKSIQINNPDLDEIKIVKFNSFFKIDKKKSSFSENNKKGMTKSSSAESFFENNKSPGQNFDNNNKQKKLHEGKEHCQKAILNKYLGADIKNINDINFLDAVNELDFK